jgi:hypothetical protein
VLGIVNPGSVEIVGRQVIIQGVVQAFLWQRMGLGKGHVIGTQLRTGSDVIVVKTGN